MACLPATVLGAYFIAIILLDLYTRDWRRAPGHALLGAFAILLTNFICERASEGVAWMLIFAPFFILLLAYILRLFPYLYRTYVQPLFSSTSKTTPVESAPPCNCCDAQPCECEVPCPSLVVKPTPKPEPLPEPEPEPKPEPTPPPSCPPPEPAKPKQPTCIKGSLE